jgi:hypothetical protein
VKFRRESPGWPSVTLHDFVGAFDAKALAAYRLRFRTGRTRCLAGIRERFGRRPSLMAALARRGL